MYNRIETDMWLQLETVNNTLESTYSCPTKYKHKISTLLISYKLTHDILQAL